MFSPDLCQAVEPAAGLRSRTWRFDPAAVKVGFPDDYVSDLCGEGGHEARTTSWPEPPGVEPGDYASLELQGTSADGSKAIFVADANLTPEAKGSGNRSASLRLRARTSCISSAYFPTWMPVTPGHAAAGNYNENAAAPGHLGLYERSRRRHLVQDGTRVFSSSGGKLYLRENPEQPQSAISSGQCTEMEKACTLLISENVSEESGPVLAEVGRRTARACSSRWPTRICTNTRSPKTRRY